MSRAGPVGHDEHVRRAVLPPASSGVTGAGDRHPASTARSASARTCSCRTVPSCERNCRRSQAPAVPPRSVLDHGGCRLGRPVPAQLSAACRERRSRSSSLGATSQAEVGVGDRLERRDDRSCRGLMWSHGQSHPDRLRRVGDRLACPPNRPAYGVPADERRARAAISIRATAQAAFLRVLGLRTVLRAISPPPPTARSADCSTRARGIGLLAELSRAATAAVAASCHRPDRSMRHALRRRRPCGAPRPAGVR